MTTQLAPGTMVAGRYKILEELGHGGNASVHRAHDERLDTDIALKVLWPQLAGDATFIERFRREAQTLARLNHPSIVRLFELGEDTNLNIYYLVLEYMTGGDLKGRLGPSPWSVDETVEVLRPVAQALDYAHTRQPKPVVHRDMKPSNILFNADGWPVVSDFGVARLLGSESTEHSLTGDFVIGTPAYMAPEQVRGKAEPSSDRYALAVIAYELLAGRVPHQGETLMETLVLVTSTPPPPPRQLNPAISEAVEQVLLQGLARDPAERYATADEFIGALEEAGKDGGSMATVVGARLRPPTVSAPTIGTPMPQVRPAPRRVVIGAPEPAPVAEPEFTVVAAPSMRSEASALADANATTAAPRPAVRPASPAAVAAPSRFGRPLLMVGGAAAIVVVLAVVGVLMFTNRGTPTRSSGAIAQPTAAPEPTLATGATVLFRDGLDSLANAKLTVRASTDPANFFLGYSSDGYVVQKVSANAAGLMPVSLPGTFDDAVLAIDAKLVDPAPNRYLALTCRSQGSANSGYRLIATPATGKLSLNRLDGDTPSLLAGPVDAPLKRDQTPNHVELSCIGETITARVNGNDVATVQDSTYHDGGLSFGAGAEAGGTPTVEAHFKNLLVSRP